MLLLLSGEGSTDIGVATTLSKTICGPGEWRPGPMATLANQLYEKHMGCSALDTCAYFVSEATLTQFAKTISHPFLRGHGQNLFHKRNAQALAFLAFKLSSEQGVAPVAVVFFRDCDGTRSTPPSRHGELYDSINGPKGGFQVAGLRSGVPMIPKPKSEAWLLCALKEHPYQHCHDLETLSGNDASPNSVKKHFWERHNALGDAACTLSCENCETCKIHTAQIDMPRSYFIIP